MCPHFVRERRSRSQYQRTPHWNYARVTDLCQRYVRFGAGNLVTVLKLPFHSQATDPTRRIPRSRLRWAFTAGTGVKYLAMWCHIDSSAGATDARVRMSWECPVDRRK
jgi:hypothetical protein